MRTSRKINKKHKAEIRRKEKRRLKRLDAHYNPNKDPLAKKRVIKSNFVGNIPTEKSTLTISFPKMMDFCSNAEETLSTLKKIREELLYGNHHHVMLNHECLEKISPECAVVLLAEIQRSLEYRHSNKRVQGNHPKCEGATQILTDIGYYKALGVKSPLQQSSRSGRVYFRVISQHNADGRVADKTIKKFESTIKFEGIVRKRLYSGLLECMDNVYAHAYMHQNSHPNFSGQWWMAGFFDTTNNQVAFVFYDQGIGIPETLKEKVSFRLKPFSKMTPSKMIREAVLHGKSREESDRHGSGLPSLKEVIDLSQSSGFLRVMSGHGDFTYRKSSKESSKTDDLAIPLPGTLISWSLNPDESTIKREDLDLSLPENEQLKLKI